MHEVGERKNPFFYFVNFPQFGSVSLFIQKRKEELYSNCESVIEKEDLSIHLTFGPIQGVLVPQELPLVVFR